jgi:hypothetical protein
LAPRRNAGWKLLNGKLELYGVDAEDVAQWAIRKTARRFWLGWPESKREELLADTIVYVWRLSERYDPTIGTFNGFARRYAPGYVIDWIREREGRTRWEFGPDAQHTHAGSVYTRNRVDEVSLDELTADATYLGHRLVEAHGAASLDLEACSDPALQGVYEMGDLPAIAFAPPSDLEARGRTEDDASTNGNGAEVSDERRAA